MLVSKLAPDFKCQAIIDNKIQEVNFYDFKNKYKILFFYPLDFTFVCPTELHAFNDLIEEFKKRDTQVFAVSVDSVYSHQVWLNQPKEEGGIMGLKYPILSDITKSISEKYDVLDQESGVAFRGLFIIDKENIVQYMQVNNLSLGRNTHEILRILDALECIKKNDNVCPANWMPGQTGLCPTKAGIKEYFKNKK